MNSDAGGFRPESPPASGRQHSSSGGDPAQPVRVLLVEDDGAIQQMVVNYLEGYNMHVTSATRRDDVIRHFATAEPNLIILDLRLGDEDGLDLSMTAGIRMKTLMSRILAQDLPQPGSTVERMVATCWLTNNVKPLPPQAGDCLMFGGRDE